MTRPTRFRLPALCAVALLTAAVTTTTLPLTAPLARAADDKPVADPAPTAEFMAKLDPQMREVVQAMGVAVDAARKAEGFAAGELKKAFAGGATVQ